MKADANHDQEEIIKGKLPRRMIWIGGLLFIGVIVLLKLGMGYMQKKPVSAANAPTRSGDDAKKKAEEEPKFVSAMERDQVRETLEKLEASAGKTAPNKLSPASLVGFFGSDSKPVEKNAMTESELDLARRQQSRERVSIAPIFKSNSTRTKAPGLNGTLERESSEQSWLKSAIEGLSHSPNDQNKKELSNSLEKIPGMRASKNDSDTRNPSWMDDLGFGRNGNRANQMSTSYPEHRLIESKGTQNFQVGKKLCDLQPGWLIPLVSLNALNSEVSGEMVAQVRENVYDSVSQNCLAIPVGSKLILTYNTQVRVGQERFQAAATLLSLPNGNMMELVPTTAYEPSGEAGLHAEVDNHYWKIFSSSLLIGLFGKWTGEDVVVSQRGWGESRTESSIFGKTLGDTASHLLERNKAIAPTLKMKVGTRFNLMLSKSIQLPPYQD